MSEQRTTDPVDVISRICDDYEGNKLTRIAAVLGVPDDDGSKPEVSSSNPLDGVPVLKCSLCGESMLRVPYIRSCCEEGRKFDEAGYYTRFPRPAIDVSHDAQSPLVSNERDADPRNEHQCEWVPSSMQGQQTCLTCHRYRETPRNDSAGVPCAICGNFEYEHLVQAHPFTPGGLSQSEEGKHV